MSHGKSVWRIEGLFTSCPVQHQVVRGQLIHCCMSGSYLHPVHCTQISTRPGRTNGLREGTDCPQLRRALRALRDTVRYNLIFFYHKHLRARTRTQRAGTRALQHPTSFQPCPPFQELGRLKLGQRIPGKSLPQGLGTGETHTLGHVHALDGARGRGRKRLRIGPLVRQGGESSWT